MNEPDFKFYCAYCDRPLMCDAQFAGRQIQCPACQHLICVPNPPVGMGFTHVAPDSSGTWHTYVEKKV